MFELILLGGVAVIIAAAGIGADYWDRVRRLDRDCRRDEQNRDI